MLAQLLIAIVLGVISGCFTGLIPGIHINLISVFIISMSNKLLKWFTPFELSVFIIAMSITHTFMDAIPSIYLGAPDEAMALSALPGHKMLLRGIGHNALQLTVIGSFFTIILSTVLIPLFAKVMTIIYPFTSTYTGYILLFIMIYLFASQKTITKIIASMFIFFLSGCFGIVILNNETLSQPLFHLLSGLFGTSLLIISFFDNVTIPKQKKKPLHIKKQIISQSILGASIAGFFSAFLPGFSTSQAALFVSQILTKIGDKGFLIVTGGLNSASMILSLVSLYVINKARNGSVIAIQTLLPTFSFSSFFYLVCISIGVAGIASFITIQVSKQFSKLIETINYKLTIGSVLVFIGIISVLFDGIIGFIILVFATILGIFATKLRVAKSNLMGCLILPVILFFIL